MRTYQRGTDGVPRKIHSRKPHSTRLRHAARDRRRAVRAFRDCSIKSSNGIESIINVVHGNANFTIIMREFNARR